MDDFASLKPGARRRWSRLVTEEDIVRFGELSQDLGRHHVERDERGRLMAHGLLTATLPTKIGGELNYMAKTMRFDFVKGVYAGDELDCEGSVVSVIEQKSRFKVKFSFEVRNQRGEVVLRGDTAGQILRPL